MQTFFVGTLGSLRDRLLEVFIEVEVVVAIDVRQERHSGAINVADLCQIIENLYFASTSLENCVDCNSTFYEALWTDERTFQTQNRFMIFRLIFIETFDKS